MIKPKSPGQALMDLMDVRKLSFKGLATVLDVDSKHIHSLLINEKPISRTNIQAICRYLHPITSGETEMEYSNCFNAWTKLVREWDECKVKGNDNMQSKTKVLSFIVAETTTLYSGSADITITANTVLKIVDAKQYSVTFSPVNFCNIRFSVSRHELNRVWPELFPAP